MKIRKATAKDWKKIVNLQLEFTRFSRGHDVFLKPSRNYLVIQRKRTKNFLKKGIGFIAEENKNAIGYITGTIKKKPQWKVSRYGHINEVFVSNKYRGKGLGKLLMKKFFDELRKKKIEYVDLSVFVKNKEAQRFYRKLGFKGYKVYMRKKV